VAREAGRSALARPPLADDTHEFLGWYVQLQAPLQGTRLGLITEWPFPTGWEDWRPDPAWPVPELAAGWSVV
jgi:hypothetical protein